MNRFMNFIPVLVLVISKLPTFVLGHGRLMEPPNRSSIWRFPEFKHLDPPENHDDNQLYCGGREIQYEYNGGKCGVCGDEYNETVPRANEDGGEYYRGIIVRGYYSGQILPVEVELTTNHKGYFEFRLCAEDDRNSHLEQECYDKHLLELADGSGPKFPVPVVEDYTEGEYNVSYYAKYKLRLPKGVTCKHCVLQWHYRTGNSWGECEDGSGALGCGNQEIFRGCSDIIIYPKGDKNANMNPNSKFVPQPPPELEEGKDEFASFNSKSKNKRKKWQRFNAHHSINRIVKIIGANISSE